MNANVRIQEQEPPEEPQSLVQQRLARRTTRRSAAKTAFGWRFLSGVLGALVLVIAVDSFWGAPLRDMWRGLTEGVENAGGHFLAMGMLLLGTVLACGLASALAESSAIRGFFLGAGWCALLMTGLTAARTGEPASPSDASLPLSLRMTEAALNPGFLYMRERFISQKKLAERTGKALQEDLSRSRAALQASRKQIGELEKQLAALENKLREETAAAEERGRKEKTTELQPEIERKDREIKRLSAELDENRRALRNSENKISELQTSLETLSRERNRLAAAVRDIHEELERARKRIKDLEAVLKPVKSDQPE